MSIKGKHPFGVSASPFTLMIATILAVLIALGVTFALSNLSFRPNPPEASSGQAVATPLPSIVPGSLQDSDAILFESGGQLFRVPVDVQGKAKGPPELLNHGGSADSKVGKMWPAPDGKRLMYELYAPPPGGCCEYGSSLHVITLPNGQPRLITPPARTSKIFGWHPNSREIVYEPDNGTIELFDVNSGKRTVAAEPQKWAGLAYDPRIEGAAFSPDGQRLVVSFTLTGSGWEVWMSNADGTGPKRLFSSNVGVFGFTWSPDSKLIAFVGRGLEIMNADGQNRRMLSQNFSVGWGFEPHWSPDGRLLAFSAGEKLPIYDSIKEPEQKVFQYHKVHLLNVVTGQEWRLVADELGGDIEPIWSLDGKRVVLLSNRTRASEVWTANLEGTELQQLTSDGRSKRSAPVWLRMSGR